MSFTDNYYAYFLRNRLKILELQHLSCSHYVDNYHAIIFILISLFTTVWIWFNSIHVDMKSRVHRRRIIYLCCCNTIHWNCWVFWIKTCCKLCNCERSSRPYPESFENANSHHLLHFGSLKVRLSKLRFKVICLELLWKWVTTNTVIYRIWGFSLADNMAWKLVKELPGYLWLYFLDV